MARPDLTSWTGIFVVLAIISVSMLWWLGSRCWISTNAIPVSNGSARKNSLYASRPPAEAPMATTGKKPFTLAACFRLGCSFKEAVGSDGRDFIFAFLQLFSMRLAAREVVHPNATRERSRWKYRKKAKKTANHGFFLPARTILSLSGITKPGLEGPVYDKPTCSS